MFLTISILDIDQLILMLDCSLGIVSYVHRLLNTSYILIIERYGRTANNTIARPDRLQFCYFFATKLLHLAILTSNRNILSV